MSSVPRKPTVPIVELDEAKARLMNGALYLDVRSEPEFEEGHADGAINVPWRRFGPQGMEPNPRFLEQIAARLTRDQSLVIGCKSNVRARAAADALSAAGFEDLVVLKVGFDGIRDQFGRVTEPGWGRVGLPVESGADPELAALTDPASGDGDGDEDPAARA